MHVRQGTGARAFRPAFLPVSLPLFLVFPLPTYPSGLSSYIAATSMQCGYTISRAHVHVINYD